MSAPAITTQVPTAPVVSSAPAASTRPVASTRPAVSTALTTAVATSIAASPSLVPSTTRSSTRRHRTTTITSASSVFPTVVPFDPAEERQADSHRTNKILIGIFSGFGVILLGLVAFQFYRWYKRRYQNKGVPLPPPRMSMYKEYPKDFSRPPSMMHHNSGSGLITPSVRSNAPSMDVRVDETGRRISDPSRAPGQITREYSPDNSLTGAPLVPNDEELGRRRSPLGSRSESPSNLSPPRPPSQAQVNPRPDPRTRAAHPPSAMANQRHSSIGAPGSNRNSTHDPNRRSSFYGTPHSARERMGLVMPQPLAPEAVNYAVSSRNDSRPSSAWGSRAGSEHDHNQTLSPPKGPRPDSWVVNVHSSTASLNDSPVTSDAPSKDGTLPRGRDRASRPEIPR